MNMYDVITVMRWVKGEMWQLTEIDDLRFGDKSDVKECLGAERTKRWKVGVGSAAHSTIFHN